MIVCSWCDTTLNTEEPSRVSHGICPRCKDVFFGHLEPVSVKEYIEGFGFPIFLVNSNVELEQANEGACAFAGKEFSEIEGRLGGNVIECVYSKHPGGCGKTVHCEACTIRNSVTRTYRTGEPVVDAVSYQEVLTDDGPRKIPLRISTVKNANSVLLKIVPA